MNATLSFLKATLFTALGGIYCYALFRLVSYALATCSDGLVAVLLISVGSVGMTVAAVLIAWLMQPMVFILAAIATVIHSMFNRHHRSRA